MSSKTIASEIIMQVLSERLNIKDAIRTFPAIEGDTSLECALHALLHYEADEDFRAYDPLYADEQVEHLEYIANILGNDDSLPVNIIEKYREYYEEAPIISKKGIKNLFKRLFRLTI